MPRKYVRKLGTRAYRNYSRETLHHVIEELKTKNISYRQASERYSIPLSTLILVMKKGKNQEVGTEPVQPVQCRTSFTTEEENMLVAHIVALSIMGFPITLVDLRNIAASYLIRIDERTKGWLLVDSPLPTLLCVLFYLIAVRIGPVFMRNRRPMKLKWILIPYNLLMTLLNLYIVIQLLIGSIRLGYNYLCQAIGQIDHEEELRIANAVWWYYFSKLLEFCDTLFLIVRKKDAQLTFLHVYHHSTVFALWWIGVKWVPSGSTLNAALVNASVHVLMYSYYSLTALGPMIAKYLWWKRYLTMVQLVQFTIGFASGINGIVSDCDFPRWMQYGLIMYMFSFIILFGHFYVKSYIEKVKRPTHSNGNTRSDKITAVEAEATNKKLN